jgi:hypothetical protein
VVHGGARRPVDAEGVLLGSWMGPNIAVGASLAADAARRSTAPCPTQAPSVHCCRVLDWDGTRRGQWHDGKVRECWVRLVRKC